MQCFTLPSLYPKTGLSYDYRAPKPEHYIKRPHYVQEPDKNGRMWAPDAFKPPLPFKMASMIFEPANPNHRDRKMSRMLEHVNEVNWTTGRDAKILPIREIVKPRQTAEFRHSDKMATVTHTTYVNHGRQPVDRKIQSNVEAIGIVPCFYPMPYSKGRCITSRNFTGCVPSNPTNIPYRRLDQVEGNAHQYRFAKDTSLSPSSLFTPVR